MSNSMHFGTKQEILAKLTLVAVEGNLKERFAEVFAGKKLEASAILIEVGDVAMQFAQGVVPVADITFPDILELVRRLVEEDQPSVWQEIMLIDANLSFAVDASSLPPLRWGVVMPSVTELREAYTQALQREHRITAANHQETLLLFWGRFSGEMLSYEQFVEVLGQGVMLLRLVLYTEIISFIYLYFLPSLYPQSNDRDRLEREFHERFVQALNVAYWNKHDSQYQGAVPLKTLAPGQSLICGPVGPTYTLILQDREGGYLEHASDPRLSGYRNGYLAVIPL